MTSIHYYNRNGVVNSSSSNTSSNKPVSIRGRTESPGLRARFPPTSASSRDSQNISRNQRLIIPTRNPEKISGNHVEQYRQQLNKVNNGLKPSLLNTNHNLTPRGAYTKFNDDQNQSLKIKQQIHNSKTRLNDLDNQNNNIMSSKPQKYLNAYTNLNQLGTPKESSNKTNIDEAFKSMNIDSKNKDYYNIITHETTNNNELTANERYKVSMGNCATGAPGSLLRASQSRNGYNGSTPQAQFYPNQQQQQQSSSSYKIPTTPSSLSSVNYQNSQSYYNTTTNATNQNGLSTDSSDLSYKGIVGLKNLGNTCFMNCVLQCLSNTRCLLEYCLSNSYQNELNTTMSVMKGSLFNSYASLIKQMWSGGSIVSLQDFKAQLARFAPRFVGYAQQDAEEFLYYLIKGLHEDVNLIRKRPSPFRFDEKAWDRKNDSEKSEEHWAMNLRTDNSQISDMFVGQLKSTLKCTKCEYKSPTFELFWHLAVPIPTKLGTGIRLDDCIKLFMSEEILDGDNKPTCSRCNEKRRCTKRYTIEKLPKILVIHLKRFLKVRYNNKISLNVDYPIDSLDMSKYLSYNVDPTTTRPANSDNNCIYDLYGISLHSGTESSGHYVAYCKHPFKNKWNYFNDTQVREISKSSLQDANAYILFYQLRS